MDVPGLSCTGTVMGNQDSPHTLHASQMTEDPTDICLRFFRLPGSKRASTGVDIAGPARQALASAATARPLQNKICTMLTTT